MAGWSMIADGSVVDCTKRNQKVKNHLDPNGLFVHLESLSKESKKLQCGFDQILWLFLEEICASDSFRPLPPMLGDGQSVDLLKLFLTVREKGGYDVVSKNRLWCLVAEESGLGSTASACLKLIYVKYLDAFERWLGRIIDDKNCSRKLSDNSLSLSGQLMEFGAELEGLLSDLKNGDDDDSQSEVSKKCTKDDVNAHENDVVMGDEKKCVDEARPLCIDLSKSFGDCVQAEKNSHADLKRENTDSGLNEVAKGKVNILTESDKEDVEMLDSGVVEEAKGKENKLAESDKDEFVIIDSGVVEGKGKSTGHKRKQESMWKMLKWVTKISKNPCDPVVGSLPESSKWKAYGKEEQWKQVLSYRESVMVKRYFDSSCEQSGRQKTQKMLPCLYDDNTGAASYNLRERLASNRSSSQLPASSQPFSSSAVNTEAENLDDQGLGAITDSMVTESVFDYDIEKQIPVGPAFQAKIPEWIGVRCEDDSKWLGTRIWPLEKVHNRFLIERERIGKGRQDSCGCAVPNSLECVRFHIAEKRYRLKLELGSAFHSWKFDKMGEEAMLSWTEEEKRNFETIVRSNPPSNGKRFWDQIVKYFRSKSREELVSYFFNVFLLQRRAHQNRFTPDNIDSDDDVEMETGSEKHRSGHETLTVPGSIMHSPYKKHKKSR